MQYNDIMNDKACRCWLCDECMGVQWFNAGHYFLNESFKKHWIHGIFNQYNSVINILNETGEILSNRDYF